MVVKSVSINKNVFKLLVEYINAQPIKPSLSSIVSISLNEYLTKHKPQPATTTVTKPVDYPVVTTLKERMENRMKDVSQ